MKLIRLDMSTLHVLEEQADQYDRLAGRALTSHIINEEVIPTCHPLGKNNKLIIATGLLTGSGASSADRYSIGAKSPLTVGIKEANAGGISGLTLGKLGIRALVFENKRDDFQIVHEIRPQETPEFIRGEECGRSSLLSLLISLKILYNTISEGCEYNETYFNRKN